MSWPARTSGVVSCRVRCASERRCGWCCDERLPGVRVRGDGADLDVGMRGEQAQHLAARVAGCAGDGDRIGHASTLLVWGRRARDGDTGTRPHDGRSAGSPRVGGRSASAHRDDARSERREAEAAESMRDDSRGCAASANPRAVPLETPLSAETPRRAGRLGREPGLADERRLLAQRRAEALGRDRDAGELRLGRLGGGQRAVGGAEAQRERQALRALGHARRRGSRRRGGRDSSSAPAPSASAARTSPRGTSAGHDERDVLRRGGERRQRCGHDAVAGERQDAGRDRARATTTRPGRSAASATAGCSSPT